MRSLLAQAGSSMLGHGIDGRRVTAPPEYPAGDVDIRPHPFVVGVSARTAERRARRQEGPMADFVLLYRGGSMAQTEKERAAAMEAWVSWFGELGNAVKDRGNPFTETARHVGSDGSIGDVPASGSASGYSIVQADSLDEATALAKGCPVLSNGGEIEVYEAFPAM
jgi:hypothetical protein